MYEWREMPPALRSRVLATRRLLGQPWHSPPHREASIGIYLLTGACFEHRPVIGGRADRMAHFSNELLTTLRVEQAQIHAWCVLPNHYHVLLAHGAVKVLLHKLGRLHGRTSFLWNGEDAQRGRKVWFNVVETAMKSDRHFWATLNYVHHNPVHHRIVSRWQDWPYGSGRDFLAGVGRERAARIWQDYPIHDFGQNWDPP